MQLLKLLILFNPHFVNHFPKLPSRFIKLMLYVFLKHIVVIHEVLRHLHMTLIKLSHQLIVHERLHIRSAADLSLFDLVPQRGHVIDHILVVFLHLAHILLYVIGNSL